MILLLCGAFTCSAAASAESTAFNKAARKFQSGFWAPAAADFGAFVTNYPTSFRVPEAILFQGESLIRARDFEAAGQLLLANQHRAGEWGDLYLYWVAQAHLGASNYARAAEAFGQLLQQYPNSTNRLEAAIGRASSLAQMQDWPAVAAFLGKPEGVFRRAAATQTNEWIGRGYLLLGEANLELRDYAAAQAATQALGSQELKPEWAWQRWHLQARIEAAQQRLDEALSSTTNLVSLAEAAKSDRLKAESYVLIAGVLEQARRFDAAIRVHEENLATTNAPVAQQRTALLKIAELSLLQNQGAEAIRRLEQFWTRHPQSEAADTVLLTWGELLLRQATGGREVATNLLAQALGRFEIIITNLPASDLTGKALLGKGWCLWYGQQIAASEEMFRAAAARLPQSQDQAVALFKIGDCQLLAGNAASAVESYNRLIETYAAVPAVKDSLLEQALYQSARAALATTNLTAASAAVQRMLEWYPNGLMGDRSLLLVAEGYAQKPDPSRARALLEDFEQRFGTETNLLLPQVRLAVARTFEKEGNWPAAISNYDAWISSFTNHPKLPEARFARAWATAMSGQETNALAMFNSIVTDFPAHDLTARAKWWIGDYHFRQGKYSAAEENYPYTTNYARSELFFPAHLRAGRAAMARLSYKDAIFYFTNLISHPSCPADLKVKAAIAAGDAFMARNEAGSTNRLPDLEEASNHFNYVLKTHQTNAQVALAWGRLGDCYKEMGASNPVYYDRAAEAYTRVTQLPTSTIGMQRQARIGLGIVAEAKAEKRPAAEQGALLREALSHYLDAFTFQELRGTDPNDVFWYQKAGLETARVAEGFGEWTQALNVYRQLQGSPGLASSLQVTLTRRIDKAREQVRSEKN
jgi:TolA-binding protein